MVAHLTPTPYALDRLGRIDRDLVVGGVAMLDAEVVIFQLDVEIGQDQLVPDEVPDDAGHLVAVELDDRIGNLDLVHGKSSGMCGGAGYSERDANPSKPQMTAPAIILSRPQLGENIGAAARAMKNFGLSDLRLVAPRDGWPNEKAATWRPARRTSSRRSGLYTRCSRGARRSPTGRRDDRARTRRRQARRHAAEAARQLRAAAAEGITLRAAVRQRALRARQ